MIAPPWVFRHVDRPPPSLEGRELAGVFCLLCQRWDCPSVAHRRVKRAVYVRTRLSATPPRQPRPHEERTARYLLTAKGRAAIAAHVTQGKDDTL